MMEAAWSVGLHTAHLAEVAPTAVRKLLAWIEMLVTTVVVTYGDTPAALEVMNPFPNPPR